MGKNHNDDYNKSHNKLFVKNIDIFKIGIWTKKSYIWLALNKISKGVPMMRFVILPDTAPNTMGIKTRAQY